MVPHKENSPLRPRWLRLGCFIINCLEYGITIVQISIDVAENREEGARDRRIVFMLLLKRQQTQNHLCYTHIRNQDLLHTLGTVSTSLRSGILVNLELCG